MGGGVGVQTGCGRVPRGPVPSRPDGLPFPGPPALTDARVSRATSARWNKPVARGRGRRGAAPAEGRGPKGSEVRRQSDKIASAPSVPLRSLNALPVESPRPQPPYPPHPEPRDRTAAGRPRGSVDAPPRGGRGKGKVRQERDVGPPRSPTTPSSNSSSAKWGGDRSSAKRGPR